MDSPGDPAVQSSCPHVRISSPEISSLPFPNVFFFFFFFELLLDVELLELSSNVYIFSLLYVLPLSTFVLLSGEI